MSNILKIITILVISGGMVAILPWFWLEIQLIELNSVGESVNSAPKNLRNNLITIQNNSLVSMANYSVIEDTVAQTIKVIATGYSSSPEETDEDPLITASGTQVKEGIVANNLLPFGTKIRIPEIYGEKIFVIEDRMNRRKGYYHIDIWFPSKFEALNFGAKRIYIEVLEG